MQEGGEPTNLQVLVETLVELPRDTASRQLRQRLAKALPKSADGRAPYRATPERRLGWSAALVVKVLAEATEPMGAQEVVEAIHERLGETVNYDSVRHTLRRGKDAKADTIVECGPGRYRLRSQTG